MPTFCFADLSLFVGVVTDRFWGERDWATPLRDSSHAFCMHGDGRFFFKKAEKDYGMLKLVTGGSLTITIGWEDSNRLDLTWYRTTFLRPIGPHTPAWPKVVLAFHTPCRACQRAAASASCRLCHWHVPARLVQNLKTGRKSENTLTQRDKLPLGVALAACLGGRDQALQIVSVETERMKSQRTWWWWHSFRALCGA